MKRRLFSVAIISSMAIFAGMAGTSWGAVEGPPVCLKKNSSEIVDPVDANKLTGNWAAFITDREDGIVETVMRLEYGGQMRFFRHRFDSPDAIDQPTINFQFNRFCNVLTDLSAEISQAFGFPVGTTFVFKNGGVNKGEVVPDEQGNVESNFPVNDIEDLLIPETTFPWDYGAIYKVQIFKQPPAPGSEPGPEPGPSEEIFADSFEVSEWNGLWTEDSQNLWSRTTLRAIDGSFSAEMLGAGGSTSNAVEAALTSIPIDLQGHSNATVEFSWLIGTRLDNGEYLACDVSTDGGVTWTEMAILQGNVDAEDTWHTESFNVVNISSLQIRFRSRASKSNEYTNVDAVSVLGW